MWKLKKCCGYWARYAIVFGIGLVISCFCPPGLMMFIVAVIIVALGVALLKKC